MPPLFTQHDNVTAVNLEAMLQKLGMYGSPESAQFTSRFADVSALSTDIAYRACYFGVASGAGTLSIPVDTINLVPFFVPRDIHIDRLAFIVTTAGGAGSKARVGIYNATQVAPFVPTTLIVDGGEFDSTAINGKIANVDVTLLGGLLYFAAVFTGVNAPTVRSGGNLSIPLLGYLLNAASTATTPITGIKLAQAYGALPIIMPAAVSSYTISGNDPLVFIRVN